MKFEDRKSSISVNKAIPFSMQTNNDALVQELTARFDQYPENKRRPVNKTLFRNDYFQLTYNVRERSLDISSRGDIVYSAIPYDTARNYIQRAAVQYLLHPEEVRKYIQSHKADLETYLIQSILQVTNKTVDRDSFEVIQAYNAIFENPLFEIQILGRLLQHDETGPLSANLAGKFLFTENRKTGIAGYLSEYLNFVVQATNTLPIMTDGRNIHLLDTTVSARISTENKGLTLDSDIQPALALLPVEVKQNIENSLSLGQQTKSVNNRPLLRSEYGEELSKVRKNYIAHSIHPDELGPYFKNDELPKENPNLINVVSDSHTLDGKFPFVNQHFNILAGDMSDSHVTTEAIKGVYVIGNHDLTDGLPETLDQKDKVWDKWRPFFKYKWFKELLRNPDDAWPLLPTGDHAVYEVLKGELEKRFSNITVLNNSFVIHQGVRYIGLTVPVALIKRKRQLQQFIFESLETLLGEDRKIPTVIVSHAPLFNELSMLSPKSEAYNRDYHCSELKIKELFAHYNIIGAIHGHHHIPASLGRFTMVEFVEKRLFVVCSIYSKINTGFELMHLLKQIL